MPVQTRGQVLRTLAYLGFEVQGLGSTDLDALLLKQAEDEAASLGREVRQQLISGMDQGHLLGREVSGNLPCKSHAPADCPLHVVRSFVFSASENYLHCPAVQP